MDFLDSILIKHQQLVEKEIDEGFKKLNLFDVSSLKVTLRAALEQDDTTALQGILDTFKAKNKDAAANRKKLKDDEKKTKAKQNASSSDMDNTQGGGRPRRKAFASANERVNNQITQTLNSKLRREDVIIKIERISEVPENQTENEQEEMPPPAALPKCAGRKKKTETKIKVEKPQRGTSTRTRSRNTNAILEETEEEAQGKGKRSDVVLIEEPMPLIALDSNDENTDGNLEEAQEETRKPNNLPKHSVIEKTRVKNSKRFASSPAENKKTSLPKRPKRKNSKMDRLSEASQYEDAVNSPEPPVEVCPTPPIKKISHGNQEVVIQLPTVLLDPLPVEVTASSADKQVILNQTYINPNTTVVVVKPRVVVRSSQDENVNDIMTDDESETESPPVTGKSNVAKELLNPFENSPLKKKVEAFEKLGSKAAAESARVTRTKTRQKANNEAPPATKVAYSTPTASNRMISTLAPTTKGNLSESAKKALSAIKLSSQRHRNFEQAAKEKEAEALRKKEIMLQKQSEDKRRKREEKEAKAKQQREEQEKERLRLQELQKAKEEQYNKRVQQQAERIQKQREDVEKRRLLAKAKHEELKREEERKRLEEERKRQEEERQRAEELRQQLLRKQRQQQEEESRAHLPTYMTHKAPLLPTPDCYDSDDENAPSQKCTLPLWNRSEAMQFNLRTMHYVPTHIRNTLFCPKPQTPDLQELFPNVDPRKLRRNSSAIWKEAPRFTMMPHMIDEHV